MLLAVDALLWQQSSTSVHGPLSSAGFLIPTAEGAKVTNEMHQLYFAGNLNSTGAVHLVTPSGQHLISHIMGVSFWEQSGKSVLISEPKDTTGQVLPEVPNSISGGLGLDPSSSWFELLTEFESSPEPTVSVVQRNGDNDEFLDFGSMQMGKGEAFATESETNKIPVIKRWATWISEFFSLNELDSWTFHLNYRNFRS